MTESAKKVVIVSAAALLSCTAVRAAEKAQFEGSTTVELPKPKRTFEESRRIDLRPDHAGPEGGFASPPPVEESPLASKRLRDELDKKKNWIFLNPYEKHYDSKTEQFLKGEKGTGLYDNALMDSEEEKKGAVEKFLHEKDKRNADNTEQRGDRQSGSDRPKERESLFKSRDESESKPDDSSIFAGNRTPFETAVFSSGAGPADPFKSNPLEKGLTRDPLPEDPFAAQKSSLTSFEKDALLEKQAVHDREFNQILQGRPGANLAPATAVNSAGEVGRLDLGGALQRRPDVYSNGGRGGPSVASFTDGTGGSSFGNRSDYGSRSLGGDSFLTEPSKPVSSFAPSLPAPSASPGSVTAPVPFVLPFPQRKF